MSSWPPRSIISNGQVFTPPLGLRARTYRDPGGVEFKGTPRKAPVTELIMHETVTRDAKTAVRVLQKRRLGVHFIIDAYGTVTQHADPAKVRLEHGAPHNVRSVGIELVNPVEARYLKPGLPWDSSIRAPWANGREYVLPTWTQAESAAQLIAWLTSNETHGLMIPRTWLNIRDGHCVMGRVAGAEAAKPGIYAHSMYRHNDGAWPLLYAFLRLELQLSPECAYSMAVVLGQQAKPEIRALRKSTCSSVLPPLARAPETPSREASRHGGLRSNSSNVEDGSAVRAWNGEPVPLLCRQNDCRAEEAARPRGRGPRTCCLQGRVLG